VLVARTRAERRRGLRPRAQGRGLLLATRSVHGWGMREPLRVVSLDAAGRVRRVAVLPPGRLFVDPGARWIVELPMSRSAPAEGMTLQVRLPARVAAFGLLPRPMLGRCPGR
jgi:uncharacterized membrane protein (UPF0127 family)